MEALKVIFVIFEALVVLNLLIFAHELGHFLAARWRGMKIDRFAIWFGKPIWKQKIGGIEYALGWIPAGGYVALPQMATMEIIEGKSESADAPLPQASPLDKIIVAFAGPLFSFLLAVAFAVVVWGVGRPVNAAGDSTAVGWVEPDGPAWMAGLRPGDEILEVDGHPVMQFGPLTSSARGRELLDSVTWRIITSEGTNIAIKYMRDGKESVAYAVPRKRPTKWYERKGLRQILLGPVQDAIIYEVATNSPAALAGLQKGDKVVAINGERIYSFGAVIHAEDAMTNGPIKPVTLTIRRGDQEFDRVLLAEKPIKPADNGPSFGIAAWQINTNVTLIHPNPPDQIQDSAGQIFATLGAVFSRKSEVGFQQLGGPVMIVRLYSNLFKSEYGWRHVLWFSVVLNVNLALLNLLPIPVLDGGHIALAVVEAIRRRPVSAKVVQFLQSACAVILIGFMLFIAFFDTGDWLRSARSDRESPMIFAPKQ
jgi:regulator of sigma E protease